MFRKTMMKNNKSKGSVSSEHKEIVRDDILQYELLEGNGPKGAPKGDPIMQVRDLHVSFATEAGVCRAVRGVNFDLWRGRTLGIVGESGSGKSVTALSLIGLLDDNAKVTGSIIMNGEELIGKTDEEMSEIRGERIAMVFQDPLSALTPMFTIGDQIAEGLITHHPDMSKQQIHDRCVELLELVGIPQPEERLSSFPHQFSGGMRQRVMIAIAIANNPDVIIADEPTTALDVTIQAQILDVLAKAQKETGAAVVLITTIWAWWPARPTTSSSCMPVVPSSAPASTTSSSTPPCRTRWVCSAPCRSRTSPPPSVSCRFRATRRRWSTSRRDARSRHDARSPPRSARCLSRTWKSWTRAPVISPPAVDCRRSSTRT